LVSLDNRFADIQERYKKNNFFIKTGLMDKNRGMKSKDILV